MKSNLYFKLDLYAIENDSEFRYICSEYPVWGYSVFIYAVSLMYRNNGQPINKKVLVMDVAHSLFTDNKEKVEEILNLCIDLGLLKVDEDGKLYSSRVQRECQKQADFNEKQRERINKRWQNTSENIPSEQKNNTAGIPTEYQGNTERNTNKQEQEQDNKEKDNTDVLSQKKGSQKDIPFTEIQEKWNKSCEKSGLPKCTKLSEKRHASIKALWLEFGEQVYTAIDKVADSDFLSGRNGAWNGCGFDWLFIKGNMLKVLEGNYDNKSASKPKHKDYSDVKKEDFDLKNFNWGL